MGLWNETTRIITLVAPEKKPAADDRSDIYDWALESRSLAIDYVYLRGTLPATLWENRANAAILPENYSKNAKKVSEERAVLAGFRLARMLKPGKKDS